MAKFINKKEQVWDFQLTTYGRHSLSVGNFKPTYYAFYDDNVIYDSRYTGDSTTEPQNDIHTRIKRETEYLEGLTLFEEVEQTAQYSDGGTISYEVGSAQGTSLKRQLGKEIFKFDSAIGDAYLDAATNMAPAWKVVALQSEITSSAIKDTTNDQGIPQVNINANYVKKATPVLTLMQKLQSELNSGVRDNYTKSFIDDKTIVLESNDPLIYVEEPNTQLLTENFSLEVFEVITVQGTATSPPEKLERKFFEKHIPQIVDGIMVSARPIKNPMQELTTDSVEYYFDVLTDQEINQKIACRGSEIFNKQSYYIDLDFECDKSTDKKSIFDIYGAVTEPEICQS